MTVATRLRTVERACRRSLARLGGVAQPDAVALAEAVGITPDPWQAAVLRSTADRLLLNCSRQSGKSTVTGVLAVHTALGEPGALVLLLSPSLRQSQELFRKCLDAYRSAGRPVAPEAESALRLELDNGARIVSLPGREGTVRGYSGVRLLVIDEASRVEDGLYHAVRPMLAVSGGRLIALSTPWGKRGWWYEAWAHGGAGWERYEAPATLCPRIPAAFLAEERAALPTSVYASEYLCQFVDVVDQVFSSEDVAAAFSAGVAPLFMQAGSPPIIGEE